MSEAEDKLAAFFAAEAPPARDAAFRLAVQARLEKRRVQIKLAAMGIFGLVISALVWRATPDLNLMLQGQFLGAAVGVATFAWSGLIVAAHWRRLR